MITESILGADIRVGDFVRKPKWSSGNFYEVTEVFPKDGWFRITHKNDIYGQSFSGDWEKKIDFIPYNKDQQGDRDDDV